jgi:hypothetical protein
LVDKILENKANTTTASLLCLQYQSRFPKIVAMAFQPVSEAENVIKPEAAAPPMDTSDLPLLLKNFSKRASLP